MRVCTRIREHSIKVLFDVTVNFKTNFLQVEWDI